MGTNKYENLFQNLKINDIHFNIKCSYKFTHVI